MSTIYRPSQFAARIGVSIKTLHRWDASGKLKAKRRPSGHRYYDESDVRKIFGGNPVKRKVVVYCRVSSTGQKDDQESLSPQQEMVEDLMTIVHTFSCRLYGLRKYETKLKEEFSEYKTAEIGTAE